jgi:hypothetical protein
VKRHKWTNQFTQLSNQSNFHERVRDLLAADPFFSKLNCYQEINVQELVTTYPHHNHHYDWYIEELAMIVELHGQQHYAMVNYGNVGYDEAMRNFYKLRDRDNTKKHAALEAGFQYVEIPYTAYKKLDGSILNSYLFGEQQ